MNVVGVYRVKDIRSDLKRALNDVDVSFDNVENVFIKPNLCNYMHASTGATTDVKLVEAFIQIIREIKPDIPIYIVESDSKSKSLTIAYELLGYSRLEKKFNNVKLVNLTKEKLVKRTVHGLHFEEFNFPELFDKCSFFVSIPKLKTFDGSVDVMTCSLKNQFGCNPDPKKWKYHKFLPQVIYDLNTLFKPDLIIVDGLVSMEGFGPADGIPKKTDLLIVGKNPIFTDMFAAETIGLPWKRVRHLAFAARKTGLSRSDLSVVGDDISDVKGTFKLPKKPLLKKILRI
jgi:uncharacterized protein (DUF362 family)